MPCPMAVRFAVAVRMPEQCNSSLNANGDGHAWFLGAHYKLGKTTLVLQGGKTTAERVANVSGVEQANERTSKNVTLGAIYSFSKRTRVFGGYQRMNVEGAHNVANTTVTGYNCSGNST